MFLVQSNCNSQGNLYSVAKSRGHVLTLQTVLFTNVEILTWHSVDRVASQRQPVSKGKIFVFNFESLLLIPLKHSLAW